MAFQTVTFSSRRFFSTFSCEEVALCLSDDWTARTLDGSGIIFGTVDFGRPLGNRGYERMWEWYNIRGDELYQFTITFDDAQLIDDPATGLPYILDCDAIQDIAPACFWRKYVASL